MGASEGASGVASNLIDAATMLIRVSEKCNDQRTAEIKFVLH